MTHLRKTVVSAFLLLLAAATLLTAPALAGTVQPDHTVPMTDAAELPREWKTDQDFTLADPAPWNLEELQKVVDVHDPRSVAAYWVWAVVRLTDDYDDGMAMMKYLFADLEPYGRGFTEGGLSGQAGWDGYFTERLSDPAYRWLPRAYFNGASAENAYVPVCPRTIELYYNGTNTETINAQTLDALGRLNIVYWVKSYAGGNQVNITLSRFEGSDRWYVTSGTSSAALFYQQPGSAAAQSAPNDSSTAEEHAAFYGRAASEEPAPEPVPLPFTDVPETGLYPEAVAWAYQSGVTKGTSETTFGTTAPCTRGQVVTFLWRAAGEPEPESLNNLYRDVDELDYFFRPVLWAAEQGITYGTGQDTSGRMCFSPEQTCSTAHILTFLYRAMRIGSDGWYADARDWADANGLLEGSAIPAERVDPDTVCPRGDVAVFLFHAYGG